MNPMATAVELARQALGTTSPNPSVGAVIVKDGVIVGEGYTLPPGQRHAEIGALQQAGPAARGAILYTTLEPCCHYGRTPPCTQAIIAAGIKEAHFSIIDPNPLVGGKGSFALQAAGIAVVIGEERQAAQQLYEAFARHITTGQPFVTAKFAMSLDGKIATHTGDSRWVTGPSARSLVQQMRKETDAVMVGINTVLADDPQLTARDSDGNPRQRQPLRVILDTHCRTPVTARMLREPGQTIIATVESADTAMLKRAEALRQAGSEVWPVCADASGRVDVAAALSRLGQRGVVSLLSEGGGIVLGSLFDWGLVNKVYAFIAPVIIGGEQAASPVEGRGAIRMAGAWRLKDTRLEQVGEDWLIVGYPQRGE